MVPAVVQMFQLMKRLARSINEELYNLVTLFCMWLPLMG